MYTCEEHSGLCAGIVRLEERVDNQTKVLEKIDTTISKLGDQQQALATKIAYWGGGVAALIAIITLVAKVFA